RAVAVFGAVDLQRGREVVDASEEQLVRADRDVDLERGAHAASMPARRRSRATASTTASPSAAELFGGGPPERWATNARSSRRSGSSARMALLWTWGGEREGGARRDTIRVSA